MARMCGCGGECGDNPCPRGQSQMALNDQLESLYTLANRWGYYDAADFIRRSLDSARRLGTR